MKIKKEELLTQTRLREVLDYNSETGEFVWIERRQGRRFTQVVGCVNKVTGYVQIGIDGYYYHAHRLSWLYVYGYFPAGKRNMLDHVDGDKTNNRLENLKECSHTENTRNQKMHFDNKSGVTGVSLNKKKRCQGEIEYYWKAQWSDSSGKQCQKYFPVIKFGNEQAKEMAITYRDEKIRELATQGVVYSKRHGTVETQNNHRGG